jgi:hypothetical protein
MPPRLFLYIMAPLYLDLDNALSIQRMETVHIDLSRLYSSILHHKLVEIEIIERIRVLWNTGDKHICLQSKVSVPNSLCDLVVLNGIEDYD